MSSPKSLSARVEDRSTSWIDRLNELVGRLAGWLLLAMVLVGAYNAVVRYLGRYLATNLSSNLYIELQWYLFSLVFLLGGAYTLLHNRHVRVDVLYGRLGERPRAVIDVIGTLLFLLPFCGFVVWVSWPTVRNSWAVLEGSSDPGGLPRYPIKTVILIGFGLLFLQGLAELKRQWRRLRADPGGTDGEGSAGGDGPGRSQL